MRHSLYWDDFQKRIEETVQAVSVNKLPDIRRVAVFITNKCNFKCDYCNMGCTFGSLSKEKFESICDKYGKKSIIHITGGEPSTLSWLYPFIESKDSAYRFHLNSNAYIAPPKNIKRLKVSLDSSNPDYFDSLVKVKGAFNRVVKNIKLASNYTVTSITCTLTKENYKNAPEFMRFCRAQFPKLYAVFFSIYKGDNTRFTFTPKEAGIFFNEVKPKLESEMNEESFNLLQETIDEKFRLINKKRFPENTNTSTPCYIAMSEKVYDWNGDEYKCSHLYRDKIKNNNASKHHMCQSGCNRRLIAFNEMVEAKLMNTGA